MNTWFLAKCKYEKISDDGKQKKVTEQYMVDALSFTEAEARITDNLTPYIKGEFKVIGLNIVNISEFFASDNHDYDKWYKIKAAYISLDEKSGKEKKSSWFAIVAGNSTKTAEEHFRERMKGTMADYTVESVVETPIIDVFPYHLEKETDETR